MTTTTTTTAGNHQTVTLDEGQALNVLPDSAGTGTAYLLDNSLGHGNSTQSWALAAGVPLQVGPFSGTRRVRIVCGTGTIQASTLPAVLNLPQIVVASSAPVDGDGRPDSTLYVRPGSSIYAKSGGTYVATGGGGGSSTVTLSGSRSLALSDNGATLVYSGSSNITLTYPSGLGSTFSCTVAELGSGKVSTQPGSGVSAGNVGQTSGPGSIMTITAVAADSYAVQNPVSNGQTLLGVSGIPFIVFASGSWTAAANGVVTVPAQTTAWPYAYIYMPANSITASNPAGWYYGVFSSTTSVTLYNNVYNVATGGTPVIPSSPTAFAVAAGSNTTQDTMPIQGPTFTVPGGSLGNNGAVQLSSQIQAVANTNTKTALIGFGSSNTVYATLNSATTPNLGEIDVVLQNLGQQTRQMFRTKTNSPSSASPTILTQDTTANISATVNLNCGTVANDWIILHYARFAYLYGA